MPPGQPLTKGGGPEGCLDDETLALLLEGALDPREEDAVRAHIDRCDACRSLFAEAARGSESGLTRPSTRGRAAPYLGTKPGDVISNKYRIEREIGVGGMGQVFAAHHLDLDQLVAIKVLRPEMLHDRDAIRRFAREGRAAAAIRSDHAVRILDVGRIEGGPPYLVMEYLEGRDLASILEKGGPLPYAEAALYVSQACEALAEAHDLGIIHRDVKPHNLFVTTGRHGEPLVKVLDFGLAKAINANADLTASAKTGTNVMLGSPFFMSPEQVDSRKDIDHRTDVWSLGATLYHIVTGVPPFVAPNIHLVCARILTEDFPPLTRRRPDAPRELEALLRRCMARDPAARFPSVRELAAALESVRALVGLGGAPSALPPTRQTSPEDPTVAQSAFDDATRRNSEAPTVTSAPRTLASATSTDDAPTLTVPTDVTSRSPGGRLVTAPQPQAVLATSPTPTVSDQPVTVTAPAAVLAAKTAPMPAAPAAPARPLQVSPAPAPPARTSAARVIAIVLAILLLVAVVVAVAVRLRAHL
ncbi:MAG: protein kinase [Deltaproteobacteria bacterium]|nr:protein kinase [Deltaproteobacteria bacterium]